MTLLGYRQRLTNNSRQLTFISTLPSMYGLIPSNVRALRGIRRIVISYENRNYVILLQ